LCFHRLFLFEVNGERASAKASSCKSVEAPPSLSQSCTASASVFSCSDLKKSNSTKANSGLTSASPVSVTINRAANIRHYRTCSRIPGRELLNFTARVAHRIAGQVAACRLILLAMKDCRLKMIYLHSAGGSPPRRIRLTSRKKFVWPSPSA